MANAARRAGEDDSEAVARWLDETKPKHIDPERLKDGVWLIPFMASPEQAVMARMREVDGRRVIDRLILMDPDITAATLRKLPFSYLTALAHRGLVLPDNSSDRLTKALVEGLPGLGPHVSGDQGESTERPKLTRPDGTDPAGFARRVAVAYGDALMKSSTPAKLLAEEAGVPVTTVHRWVRDARRLGFLPPARRGRAG